jgi:Transposase DDE domain group 1
MKTPTTSTGCVAIQRSSWLAGDFPTPAATCARSRPSRAGRTRPCLRDLIRLRGVMIDLYCTSYSKPPPAVTLDIDDTVDVVHGHQQLSLFNAHGACPRA